MAWSWESFPLSKEQKQLLIQGDLKHVSNAYSLCDIDLVSVPLKLENVGNGVTINLQIGLNKCIDKNPVYITPTNLKQSVLIYVHILAELNFSSQQHIIL